MYLTMIVKEKIKDVEDKKGSKIKDIGAESGRFRTSAQALVLDRFSWDWQNINEKTSPEM